MTDRVSEGMLPIESNLTSALLDEFDPDFVRWMMGTLRDMTAGGGSEAKAVRAAIAKSESFKKTLNAAIYAMKQTTASMGEGSGEVSMVILLLIAGWKLCERRMGQLAREAVT